MSNSNSGCDAIACIIIAIIGLILIVSVPNKAQQREIDKKYATDKIVEIMNAPMDIIQVTLKDNIPREVIVPGSLTVKIKTIKGPKADIAYLISSMYGLGPTLPENPK